ncbi:unnamed protein product, partial [Chrysoparadoxa australica]
YHFERYAKVDFLLWKTITSQARNWRSIYKGLILLQHLLINGAERIITDTIEHISELQHLADFAYFEGAMDRGNGVREKAISIMTLLENRPELERQRKEALDHFNHYGGVGAQSTVSRRASTESVGDGRRDSRQGSAAESRRNSRHGSASSGLGRERSDSQDIEFEKDREVYSMRLQALQNREKALLVAKEQGKATGEGQGHGHGHGASASVGGGTDGKPQSARKASKSKKGGRRSSSAGGPGAKDGRRESDPLVDLL